MIEKLKETVELKFGRKIGYQKDCKDLSSCIFNKTNQVVSPSTLRRLFGFLSTNSNPSNATLDILSLYCGYKDWEEFKSKKSFSKVDDIPLIQNWKNAKTNARTVSSKYIEFLKKQTTLGFDNTAPRKLMQERLNAFLESKYKAKPIIGPGGYGKTTLLINWYEKHFDISQSKNDIILFLPANTLESFVRKDQFFEDWLLSILNLDSSSLFETLREHPQLAPGKFILIIDALDEISLNQAKTEKIFSEIHLFLSNLPSSNFKLIISSRFSTWNRFNHLNYSAESWYLSGNEFFTTEGANIPPLNEDEIQFILDKTVNSKQSVRLIVEEFSFDFLQIISYPYYLQLFVNVYNPETSHLLSDKIDLLSEFIKNQIYQDQFSDEKLDILHAIIDLSHKEKSYGSIKRNDLKDFFPIHLKLAGNYFDAYEQLLSFGIITEELIDNQYGAYTKKVKISQYNLYELLTIYKLIDINGGIDCDLFKKVEERYEESTIQSNLINLLFEIAYKRKLHDCLKHFFTLKEQTLKKVFEHTEIQRVLSKDEFMRRELIPIYASNPIARKFLFERFTNLNSIAVSSRFLIYNYLQNSKVAKDVFFGKTLLCISDAYSLDFSWVNSFSQDFPYKSPLEGSPALISGLWFSCKIMESYFLHKDNFHQIEKSIDEFCDINAKYWNNSERNSFELGLMLGFSISRRYDYIQNRYKHLIETRIDINLTNEEKVIKLFFEYFKWRSTSKFDQTDMQEIHNYLNELPIWISYHATIIGKSFLAIYYLSIGNMEKAYELYQKAIEISNLAGYTIFEVKLLKNLSKVLTSIGEKEKAVECDAFVISLAEKSKVDFDMI
jgi:tetratricopeptide (TPR) repeat protein